MGEVKCKHCNDSGRMVNNMGEFHCYACMAPMDRTKPPGRLADEPVDPRFQRKPPLEDRVAALERAAQRQQALMDSIEPADIVWMGRRRDTGEVEEVGRGASMTLPAGYACVWPVMPARTWPCIVSTSSDGTVDVAFASESEAPRTVSELPEVVQGEQPIEVPPLEIDVDWPSGIWRTTLTAAEVTEPGWYWYRGEGEWGVLEVHGVVDSTGVWLSDVSAPALIPFRDLPGTFIGPLSPPA